MDAPTSSLLPATPSHQAIAERARALWIERGRPDGQDLEHWLDAERQLHDELTSRTGGRRSDEVEADTQLDGLVGNEPSSARRTPDGEQL